MNRPAVIVCGVLLVALAVVTAVGEYVRWHLPSGDDKLTACRAIPPGSSLTEIVAVLGQPFARRTAESRRGRSGLTSRHPRSPRHGSGPPFTSRPGRCSPFGAARTGRTPGRRRTRTGRSMAEPLSAREIIDTRVFDAPREPPSASSPSWPPDRQAPLTAGGAHAPAIAAGRSRRPEDRAAAGLASSAGREAWAPGHRLASPCADALIEVCGLNVDPYAGEPGVGRSAISTS